MSGGPIGIENHEKEPKNNAGGPSAANPNPDNKKKQKSSPQNS
jgi:hypothetical protein